jgi:hypothetical protein
MIAGLIRPWAHRAQSYGLPRPPEERPVHSIPELALFPHTTAEGNIALPLQMAKMPAAAIPGKVQEALEDVRLTGFGKRYPHELSGAKAAGGHRARWSPIRLFCARRAAGCADAKLREEMQIELINLQKEVGITRLWTHDQTEALALSPDRGDEQGTGRADRRTRVASPGVAPGRFHRHLQPAEVDRVDRRVIGPVANLAPCAWVAAVPAAPAAGNDRLAPEKIRVQAGAASEFSRPFITSAPLPNTSPPDFTEHRYYAHGP